MTNTPGDKHRGADISLIVEPFHAIANHDTYLLTPVSNWEVTKVTFWLIGDGCKLYIVPNDDLPPSAAITSVIGIWNLITTATC